MWECGLKPDVRATYLCSRPSLLMWECGLKPEEFANRMAALEVTPYVGVWIETNVL
mgnify:CR=1 FL=1